VGEHTGGQYGMGTKPELEGLGGLSREGRYRGVPDATQQHELGSQRPIIVQEMDGGR
jgi:hypothetical protein